MKLITKEKSFYKKVMAISLPIAMQSLITLGVNLADNIMVGRLGETALSGVTLGNEYINFYQICCMGIGMGASVLTARFYGAKDTKSLQKTITIMLRIALVFAAIFTCTIVFAPQFIMEIYTNQPDIVAAGVTYFKWSVPRFLLIGLTLSLTNVLRSLGQVRVPLVTSILAFFMNIILNYGLIFGKLGLPKMEIAGAAIATVISRIFECSVILIYFLFFEKKVNYQLRYFTVKCGSLVKEYFRVSIPVLISDSLLGLGNSVVATVIGHLGASFIAANAITNTTRQLSTVVIQGVSQSGSIVIGHTLGEGDEKRAQEEGEAFLGLGMIFGALAAVLIQLIGDIMISFYNVSPETKAVTEQLMIAISIIVFFQACNSILTKGVLRGGGDTKFLMYADILFLWCLSIPLGMLSGFVWKLTPFLIYISLKADQIIKTFWSIWRLKSGKWIKKIQSEEVHKSE